MKIHTNPVDKEVHQPLIILESHSEDNLLKPVHLTGKYLQFSKLVWSYQRGIVQSKKASKQHQKNS